MEAWASYALSDFLMFSPASYFRQYELTNLNLWPGQLPLLAIAAWLGWATHRPGPRSGLRVALLLAAIWGFVAGWFFYRQYAQINLAAGWFALAFLLQALLLLVFGVSERYRRRVVERRVVRIWHPGMLLFVYALLVHPIVGLLVGRSWRGVELFGVAPDATALATLGILLTAYRASTWPLLAIPFAWCGVSALTYLAMQHVHGVAPLVLAVTALVATMVLHRDGRSGTRSSNDEDDSPLSRGA